MGNIRWRKQHDGTLTASGGRRPPEPPPGYVRYSGDPWRFLPELPACEHRELRLQKSTCCDDKQLDFCTTKNTFVLYSDCQACLAAEGKAEQVFTPLTGKHSNLKDARLYQALYEENGLFYGQARHNRCPGVRYLPKFKNHLLSPVIDLGCGTGDTVRAMRGAGFTAKGADWIALNNDIRCDITEHLDLSEYNSAICIDVLEHVTDDKLQGLLDNLAQVKHQAVTVHCASSKERGFPQELHTNIKTKEQWIELLERQFEIIATEELAPHRFLFRMRRKHDEEA